jgi:hypothetical protein
LERAGQATQSVSSKMREPKAARPFEFKVGKGMTNASAIPNLLIMTQDTKTPDLETPAPEAPTAAQNDTNHAGAYASAPPRFETFEDFYPYYISEHSHPDNRRLHVIGTGLALLCLTQVVMWGVIGGFWSLVWAAIFGFGFAAASDHFIAKIKPTALTHPAYSLMADFKMFWEVVTRKRAF